MHQRGGLQRACIAFATHAARGQTPQLKVYRPEGLLAAARLSGLHAVQELSEFAELRALLGGIGGFILQLELVFGERECGGQIVTSTRPILDSKASYLLNRSEIGLIILKQFPRNMTNLLSIHAANPSSRSVESISLRKVR